jgi:hypothetical protein
MSQVFFQVICEPVSAVKRHPELLTGRHEELTPMVLADVKQAASERALK